MPYSNPWKKLGSRVVYENPWLTLREDRVIRPDGDEGIYGVVETRIATAVIALTPEREVYLVGQFRYTMDVYSWELIEGGTEPGEDPLTAIQRELKEEAGLVAKRWRQLGDEIHLSNCISSETGYVFVAEDLTQCEPDPDGTEVLQIKKVPFDECLRMMDEGIIKDAVSIVGLMRLDREWRQDR